MENIQFQVIPYHSPLYQEAVSLRYHVLRKPLGLAFSKAELLSEENHIQIIGILEKTVCATAVLVPEKNRCKLQRVAVSEQLQNKGIGSQLLDFCETKARLLGCQEIVAHVRESAVSFYIKNHYMPLGAYFEEDSIPHIVMTKILQIPVDNHGN